MANTELLRQQITQALNGGTVEFDFIKADGSYRTALGTRNVERIMDESPTKDEDYFIGVFKENDDDSELILYFDLEKGAIRSVRPDTIVPRQVYFIERAKGREQW